MTEQAPDRPCAACGKPAVPFGRFCPECYGECCILMVCRLAQVDLRTRGGS